jgi:hypothetical protein
MKPPKSYEKPTSPSPLNMRGLQRRGKIYWYAKITEDQGEAAAKVLAPMTGHPHRCVYPSPGHDMTSGYPVRTNISGGATFIA